MTTSNFEKISLKYQEEIIENQKQILKNQGEIIDLLNGKVKTDSQRSGEDSYIYEKYSIGPNHNNKKEYLSISERFKMTYNNE